MINAINLNNLFGILIDVVAVMIIIIALVAGAKKGLIKMCCGFISSVIVLVVAIMAASPLTGVIVSNTTWDNALADTLEVSISPQLPEPNLVISYHDFGDGNGAVLAFQDSEGYHVYDEIFNNKTLYKSLSLHKIIRPAIVNSLKTADSVYLIKAITSSISTLIILVATFFALLIAAKIVISILFHLLKKAVSSLYIMHFFDRFTGAVFGIAIGLVVILVILTVLQILETYAFMDPVNLAIEKSYLTKFAAEHNYLYKLIADRINISELLAKIKI